MRLRVELVASVAKDPQRQDLNEDAYAYSVGQCCIALADGASESYDSQAWAQLLAQTYLRNQRVSVQWIEEQVQTYVESIDPASLSWSRQAAYERGSFSTLLGLELAQNGRDAEVLAIGDSLAIHVRDGVRMASFPFKSAEEFDARPQLLSTLSSANAFVGDSKFFTDNSATWEVSPGDYILLVTDAVGHWVLSHSEALTSLQDVTSPDEFLQLVLDRRRDHSMRLDDSTILRICVDADQQEQKK